MMRLLLSLLLLLSFLQMNAQTYPKVILPGDYPDPSIMRDGKDYYMTHSPFYYAPGFLIWHSQDLMNWEPLCRVMPQYEGSAMAPDLLKYKDTYYIYYPAAGTNWVMWAKNIRGPWSRPVDLKVGGLTPVMWWIRRVTAIFIWIKGNDPIDRGRTCHRRGKEESI